jgi:hypothetical protein
VNSTPKIWKFNATKIIAFSGLAFLVRIDPFAAIAYNLLPGDLRPPGPRLDLNRRAGNADILTNWIYYTIKLIRRSISARIFIKPTHAD